jgi:hypothetical protein
MGNLPSCNPFTDTDGFVDAGPTANVPGLVSADGDCKSIRHPLRVLSMFVLCMCCGIALLNLPLSPCSICQFDLAKESYDGSTQRPYLQEDS